MRRVVVTGLGVVSPVGVGVDAFWGALTRGVGGIRPIARFDASPFATRIAGEVHDFDPLAHLPRRDVVRTDPFIQYALVAASQAIADAKLEIDGRNERVGTMIGNSMGGIGLLMTAHDTLREGGPAAVSPYALPGSLPTMAAGWVAMRTGARGPIGSPTTACAAGNQAIGEAFRIIQRGDADAMLAGGTDALVQPIVLGCFCALRALSTRNEDPEAASRPFDRDRDGFVLAEGAGILVLEEYEAACARGAHVYAEVVGYGVTADASHPTMPSTDGPARAMALALADAGLRPEDVDYVNAHGTSTPHNDANETRAIKRAFGVPRRPARRQLDQVHDRPPQRRRRGRRVDRDRAGHRARAGAADNQLPDAGSRVRPRLRPQRRAAHGDPGRPVQLVRLRRGQRHPRLPPGRVSL